MRALRNCLLLSLLLVISACGKAGPRLAATSGIVTYQGNPVVDAQVVFMSQEKFEGRAWPASSETDGDGKYVLTTAGVGPGALLGKHTVTITKRGLSPGAIPGSPAVGNESLPEMQAYMQPGPALIPQKYFSPVTSTLEVEITSSGNTHNFDLKD